MPSTRKISSPVAASASRDEGAQALGHRRFDFEPDHRAAAAALQRRLEQPHEILGLFLDHDVAVADDAKGALPAHLVARKQARR